MSERHAEAARACSKVDGTFKRCSADDGHRSKLVPLPGEEPPTSLLGHLYAVLARARPGHEPKIISSDSTAC